ncbi:MAG: membrane dipeptidase [Rhodomicrobium sp.]
MGIALYAVLAFAGLLIAWTLLVRLNLLTATQFFCPSPAALPQTALGSGAKDLHSKLRVADLHTDVMMWRKDLNRRSRLGHFDFPRMRDGNGVLQLFLSVTEIPRRTEGDNIDDCSDRLTLLGIVDQWPVGAVLDQTKRALYYGQKLRNFCAKSKGEVRFIETASQLRRLLDDRITSPSLRGAVLGLESSDGTKYAPGNIKRLFAAGYRTCSLVHLNDSAFAASASGVSKGGLTPLGRDAVKTMNETGMIIDLAHAAPRVIEDVLGLSKRVPFISHTGAKGAINDPKNMPDELLRAVAGRGGVVGLCFVRDYVGGGGINDILRSLEYMIKIAGPKVIALGSGFDSFPTPIAVDQLPYLTQALLSAGYDHATIGAVMGENVIQFLLRELPQL